MSFIGDSTKLAEISCRNQDEAWMLMNRRVDCLSIFYKIQIELGFQVGHLQFTVFAGRHCIVTVTIIGGRILHASQSHSTILRSRT